VTIVSFLALFAGIAAVIFVAHLIFFDWYATKRQNETEAWQEANNFLAG
tara:strand:+ start:623 stop:769 length:147 start_codon:yes stop_codon:yes gene_type:complete